MIIKQYRKEMKMKKRFDKTVKIFFAMAMIFSQMYSPLSVFAETTDDTIFGY